MSATLASAFAVVKTALLVALVLLLMGFAALAEAEDKNQELIRAVGKGDLAKVTRLLNGGADVASRSHALLGNA